MSLIGLHVHTMYSFLDGMCKVEELVLRAKELGMKAVAITDHGNMCGVYDLYKTCKKHGVQPIFGIEFYHRVSDIDKRLHLIAFAKSMKGLKNLYKLHELSHRNAEKGAFGKMYPIVTYEDLFHYKEDIIISTACLAGHIPQLILHGQGNELFITIETLKQQFGEDLYLELQANTIPEQKIVNSELVQLGKLYNIKTIVTSDTHYVYESDSKVHEMMLCMQTQDKMSNENRFKFSTNDFWFKSEEEILKTTTGVNQKDLQIAIDNTNEIADKCNFVFELPNVQEALPKYSDNENQTLRELCNKGWKEKKHGKGKTEIDRTNYELSIIESKGYSGYYLIVSDYINWAKSNGIIVGGGRGSGVGSFVAYLTGMTSVNPIEHGLLFERFLNPERYTSPDFDVDFSDRDAVVQYLRERWGNISSIIAFGTLTAKAVIRKILSIHGFTMAQINEISKSLPKKLDLELSDCESSKVFMKYKKEYPDLFNAMYRLEGTIDHASQHAAGILITPKEISEFVPALYDHNNNILIAGFDKYMLEELGLYKFDILKLITLNVVDDTIKLIKQNQNIDINFDNISRSDKAIYDDLCKGNVFGVFQLADQQDLTVKLQPRNFSALTALNAIIRPGVGDINTYTKRMNGEPFEYYHDSEQSYMAETFNTITYQEQFMLRVHTLAGWTLGKGDSLRKVKHISQNTELAELYKVGCKQVGYITDDIQIEKSWQEIVSALEGGYSFNKSHACSYADLSYQTAWLKHYYPLEFMTALMTSEREDCTKISERLMQCKLLGIKILPPDINKSGVMFKAEHEGIRFSYNTIKGVGDTALQNIQEIVPVNSLADFLSKANQRVVDKTVVVNLIKAGCFDFENPNRYELIYQYLKQRKDKTAEAYNNKQCLTMDIATMDKEVLGFYLSASPFDQYNFKSLTSYAEDTKAIIGGEIATVKTIFDKNNNKMAFVTVTTQYNNVEVIVFAKQFAKYEDELTVDNMVMCIGKKQGGKLLLDSLNVLGG